MHPNTLACAPTHPLPVCTHSPGTHKDVEELEDALVCQDVQDVARDGLDDGQAVDLVLDQGVDSVEEAVGDMDTMEGRTGLHPGHSPPGVCSPPAAGTHLLLGEM